MASRSWLEINLAAIAENFRRLIVHCNGVEIMPAVKADAYRHGAVKVSQTLVAAGVKKLAVATADEGAELRAVFPNRPELPAIDIQILGAIFPEEIPLAVSQDLTLSVHDCAAAEAINREAKAQQKIISVHLKIDSGMGRLGALPENSVDIATKISALSNLKLNGAFMHFADAGNALSAERQMRIFTETTDAIKNAGVKIPCLHAANSAAAILYSASHFDLIRPGAAIYGFYDGENLVGEISLIPAMTWKTQIAHLKEYPENSPLGYGSTFVTSRRSLIAVLPIGYADGYNRHFGHSAIFSTLSTKENSREGAQVLIAGNFAPVVGRISMDYTLVDVTDVAENVGLALGDEVVLLGASGEKRITLEHLAKLAGTIPYEIATSARPRGGRIWLDIPSI